MGTALTGLLQGFSDTHLKLLAYDADRKKEQDEIDYKKEDLALRRKILQGQEAARTLSMQKDQLEIQKYTRDLFQEHAGADAVARANQPGGVPPGGTEAFLKDYGRQGTTPDPALTQGGAVIPPSSPLSPPGGGTITQAPGRLPRSTLVPSSAEPGAPLAAPFQGPTVPPPPQFAGLPNAQQLSPAFYEKLQQVAANVGANPADLLRTIHFETGGTYAPTAVNPLSGATGILQWLPTTAKGMGTSVEALKQMTPEQQLDYVETYLKGYKGQLGSLKDVYMAVLSPANIGKSPDTVLFKQGSAAYEQNRLFDTANKGYITVGDAVNKVQQYAQAPTGSPSDLVADASGRVTPGPGAGAPATPLARQPAPLAESPELGRINSSIADWEGKKQRLDALVAASPGLGKTKDVVDAYARYDKELTRLREERKDLTKEQTPGDVFKAILLKNKGDLDKTIADYQQLQVEQKSAEGKAGVEARLKAEQAQRRTQTLQETWKDDASLFVNTLRCGKVIPAFEFG